MKKCFFNLALTSLLAFCLFLVPGVGNCTPPGVIIGFEASSSAFIPLAVNVGSSGGKYPTYPSAFPVGTALGYNASSSKFMPLPVDASGSLIIDASSIPSSDISTITAAVTSNTNDIASLAIDLSGKADLNGNLLEDFSIKNLETTNASVTGALAVNELRPENFTCPGTFIVGTTTPDLGSGTRTFIQSPIQWENAIDTLGGVSVGKNLVIQNAMSNPAYQGHDMERWYKAKSLHCSYNTVIGTDNYYQFLPYSDNVVLGNGNCGYGGNNTNVVFGAHCLSRGNARNTIFGNYALDRFQANNYGSYCTAFGDHAGRYSLDGTTSPSQYGSYNCIFGSYVRIPVATTSYYMNINNVIRGYYDALSGAEPRLFIYPDSPALDTDLTVGDAAISPISFATSSVEVYVKLNLKPQTLPATPVSGDIVVDSGDANKLKYYDGSSWQTGSGGGSGGASLVAGVANFAGFTASTTVTIAAQANTSYKVLVTPSENPGGNLGETWVEKLSTTQFAVHNSGSAVTEFNWGVTP